MVTVKVESKEQAEFLHKAFEHVWKIKSYEVIDISNIAKQINALGVENQTLELTENQAKVFRVVMQLYYDVSADDVNWSYDYIKQLSDKVKDAPRFYELLRDFGICDHAERFFDLFKYWITGDPMYFNGELLDIMDEFGAPQALLSIRKWCTEHDPFDTQTDNEISYYKKEYCN